MANRLLVLLIGETLGRILHDGVADELMRRQDFRLEPPILCG
jgi:hypothetical protein